MNDFPAALRTALTDRYRVERQLGRGGMATVYQATDIKHQRQVAIKLLDRSVAGMVSVDRFLKEIRVMATLQHPHILPLFDSGEAAGELYYVMPYVEGETLRARIKRERRLSVEDATRITREVASALDFAHRQGVVHRDIKPENILLADGHALVADFGIARALLSDAVSSQQLTATGLALGTKGYMSPEQAAGDQVVDARSDIYALGVVTHEMLSGEPPFSGSSAQVVLSRMLTEPPPSLEHLRRGLAPNITAAVQKALSTEPSDRFSTASGFALALGSVASVSDRRASRRWLPWVAGAGVAAITVGVLLARGPRPTPVGDPSGVRVAVVPFREVGESGNTGFGLGLTTALRGDLATFPNLGVIAGTSIDALGDSAQIPRYVAQQLGATHVISGTVFWDRTASGEVRVRVVPELIDFSTGAERSAAADAVEDRLDDLFRTQARVSAQIARALGVGISAEAATRLAEPPTLNREAYQAYLLALREPARLLELLQQAVAVDSMFVGAWAQLGASAAFAYQVSLSPALADLADRASARALALAPGHAGAQFARSIFERHVTRDFEAAVRHSREALRLAPGSASYMHFTAAALWNSRRFDEALAMARRGAALDPRSADAAIRVATLLIWQREFRAAEAPTGAALALAGHRVAFINVDSILLPVANGDLQAARDFVASLPDSVAFRTTSAFAIQDWHLGWILDPAQRAVGVRQLQRTGAIQYHVGAAQDAWLAGDTRRLTLQADSAIAVLRKRLDELPGEERLRLALAFAYAYAGRFDEAVAQGDSAVTTRSAWKDGFLGAPNSLMYAEVLALSGRTEHAIALADSLLAVPGFVTPQWLRLDPYFAGLRSHPRFQALSGG